MDDAMDVLICTYERPAHVLRAARDALAQLGPRDSVLVLDQSRRVQSTARAIAALGDSRIGHEAAPARGLPHARNEALARTTRPLVLFVDDDVRLHPGCLEAHRRGLTEPDVGATVGPVDERGMRWNARRTTSEVDAWGRVRVRLEGAHPVDVGSVKGCNMGFSRGELEAIGGFDPGYSGTSFLEEADVSERLRVERGRRIRFLPSASLTHLSAPAGGVRVGSPQRTAWWRFHNTGRFVARHRRSRLLPASAAFAAIAARRGAEWRDPVAPTRLMSAFWRGVWGARSAPTSPWGGR